MNDDQFSRTVLEELELARKDREALRAAIAQLIAENRRSLILMQEHHEKEMDAIKKNSPTSSEIPLCALLKSKALFPGLRGNSSSLKLLFATYGKG